MGGNQDQNGTECQRKSLLQNQQLDDTEELRPPEGGWGWMVVFGMAVMFIATTGQYGSFGLLFGGLLAHLGEETTGATLIMNALAASVNFTGLVTNRLLKSMSYRMVSVIGALLFTLGMMLTIFSESMVHIVISYSIISGIGLGLVAPSSYLAFNSYFLERRGLAMGICQAAIGLGFIAAPPLVQYLLNFYGYRGTMLILSGIALNAIVGAILYQPVSRHLVKATKRTPDYKKGMVEIPLKDTGSNNTTMSSLDDHRLSIDVIPDEEDDITSKNGTNHCNGYTNHIASEDDMECEEHVVISRRGSMVMSAMLDTHAHLQLLPVKEEVEEYHKPYNSTTAIIDQPQLNRQSSSASSNRPSSVFLGNFASNVLMFDNTITVPESVTTDDEDSSITLRRKRQAPALLDTSDQHHWSLLNPPIQSDDRDEDTPSPQPTKMLPPAGVRRIFYGIMNYLDLNLLNDLVYVNIILGLSISFLSDTNFFTVFPFFLQSVGISSNDTALCMSVAAGADVVSRLLLPWLADKLNIGPRTAYMIGCLLSAVARSVFAALNDFISLLIMSSIVGLLKGIMVVNLSLTIAEHCHIEQFAAAYSLYMVINGIITVTLGPVVGVVRDQTGSFPTCIHMLSALMLLCVITWSLEYLTTWYRRCQLNLAHKIKNRLS